MADALKLYTAFGLLYDEYEEYIQENIYLTMISCLLTKQKISRIVNFAEVIVPQFSDENFRLHFRISREMFQEILNRVGPSLLSVWMDELGFTALRHKIGHIAPMDDEG